MVNRYAPLAFLALLMSCSDPGTTPAEPLPEPPGNVTFTYASPVISGAFSAIGDIDEKNKFDPKTSWAYGIRVGSSGTVDVFAQMPANAAGAYRFLAHSIPETPGPSQVKGTVVLFLDFVPAPSGSCGLGTGTLTITSISEKRLTGTFSGSGMCIPPGGIDSFQMTGGSFDVPLRAGHP